MPASILARPLPSWPFCAPLFLPEGSLKPVFLFGFLKPSFEGGMELLVLLVLFLASRRLLIFSIWLLSALSCSLLLSTLSFIETIKENSVVRNGIMTGGRSDVCTPIEASTSSGFPPSCISLMMSFVSAILSRVFFCNICNYHTINQKKTQEISYLFNIKSC